MVADVQYPRVYWERHVFASPAAGGERAAKMLRRVELV